MVNNMSLYLGIDLGTSGLKAVFVSPDGNVRGIGYGRCRIDIPQPGYAEQDPQAWYETMCRAVREGLKQTGESADQVKGISLSGHMHGTVLMDRRGRCCIPPSFGATRERAKRKNGSANISALKNCMPGYKTASTAVFSA